MIAFPSYFAIMPSLIDEKMLGGSSGINGEWAVSFEENTETLSETINLGDGESYDSFFDITSETNIGYIELSVSCMDNDDPGPGFADSVDGNSDLSGVDGDFEDKTDQGTCAGGGSGFTMRWDVTTNYTGENITQSDMTEQEIREEWSDMGLGRGTWSVTITADISAPPAPIVGEIVDSDEDYIIEWTMVTYVLAVSPLITI